MSVPLLATWPAMGERERGALMVEVGGSCVERKSWNFGNLEFWKMEFLWIVEEGREIRKRKKEKNSLREDIFSWTQNETVEKTDSRD